MSFVCDMNVFCVCVLYGYWQVPTHCHIVCNTVDVGIKRPLDGDGMEVGGDVFKARRKRAGRFAGLAD